MTMQEQLRALIERHLANLDEQLAKVSELLTPTGATATLPVAQVAEAEGITHQLKGTTGSMGFAEIGAAAQALDENLKAIMRRPEPIPACELELALERLGTLQRLAKRATPAMSALYNADLSKLVH